jgi:hypothetical protein
MLQQSSRPLPSPFKLAEAKLPFQSNARHQLHALLTSALRLCYRVQARPCCHLKLAFVLFKALVILSRVGLFTASNKRVNQAR